MTCEMVTDPCAEHGEGVIWDVSAARIRWVDMLAGDVLSLDDATGQVSRLHVGTVASAIRPRVDGGLVIAVERGFALLSADSHDIEILPEIWTDPTVRMNDGACDSGGRFYCGSMAYDAAPHRGALYRLDPTRTVTRVLDAVTISNGLAWSPDGTVAYYVDSATQRVDAFTYDVEAAALTERRPIVTIDEADGTPDGLTVDGEGYLWVAMWAGSAVRRYDPGGRLDRVVEIPARHVTACAFGGPGLADLYITTSRLGLAADVDPLAGALFRFRPGVQGLAVRPFAG
jgi:sugar lactone lactonase YvrE